MLKATYSEEDIYETWQLVALVELSPLGKCWSVSLKRLILTSRVGESEVQAERSHKAANCVMTQLLLRDATKASELFEKSMKVYLNLAERACAEPVEAKSPSTTTS